MRGNNANCFLHRMANLLIFIHNGGIRKVITQSRLNNGTHFSCYECLPKEYNVQMSLFHFHEILCHAMVDNKVMWWPECIQPPTSFPQKKNAPRIVVQGFFF